MKDQPATAESLGSLDQDQISIEKIQSLLKAKDDTSRFVGLALLKAVLDNGALTINSEELSILWGSLSSKFLDRLLRAGQNDNISPENGKDMVDLAVAVLHTFIILLPEEARKDSRLTKRIAPLVKSVSKSSPETTDLILKTLVTLVSQPEGAQQFLKIEDKSSLIGLAKTQPLAFKVFYYTWSSLSSIHSDSLLVRKDVDDIIPKMLHEFEDTDGVTLIESLGDLLPSLSSESCPIEPTWLPRLVSMIRRLVISRPTLSGRAAYTKLASSLLQIYPVTTPVLLFKDSISKTSEDKPFSYLFINLLLIDLRSSFPSLLPKLNSTDYPSISQRLAAAFDILSSFIGFLIRSLDQEAYIPGFSVPPDLLLKLRKDIAETISLTIEYLRDRWDASIAGAAGLHPTARVGTAETSEGSRLTLTWDSMNDNVSADPLVLAGLRGMALWIREDENENLRNEATGLMDMLLELYRQNDKASAQYRYPILLALEGVLLTDEALDVFLGQQGYMILAEDLHSIVQSAAIVESDASRGTQIIRVLLAVLDHSSTTLPDESWMEVVKSTTTLRTPTTPPAPCVLEFFIACVQLSTALLSKSSGGMTKRYITTQPALRSLTKQLKILATKMEDRNEGKELEELLDDVVMDLGNL